MKLTRKIAIAAAAGALTVSAGATAFAAGASATEPGGGPKAEFACAHVHEIEAQQQAHLDLLAGRLHLLQEADAAATAGGHDAAAARIERRIGRTNERIAAVTARQGKFATWASSHCNADGTPVATAPTTAG